MIKQATYLADYRIKVLFDDGTTRDIDLYGFLSKSRLPIIRQYLDLDKFRQFSVEDGALAWGDNEFDLNPINIYRGQYDA